MKVSWAIALLVAAVCVASVSVSASDHVSVELYYESQCPYCMQWLTGGFKTAWDKDDIRAIMDVNLVPYGNAREQQDQSGKWIFTCQHGERECAGNLVETCAITLNPDTSKYVPFIMCVEAHDDPADAAESCAQSTGLDYQAIAQCVDSDQGNKAQHDMATKTAQLSPPHQYVPWIVVNGEHTEDLQNECQTDLVACVCKRYTGADKPASCNSANGRTPVVFLPPNHL